MSNQPAQARFAQRLHGAVMQPLAIALMFGSTCALDSAAEPAKTAAARVDAARILAADSEPGSWLTHGRTYSEQRYSPLTGISADNIHQLGLAWSYMTGTKRGLESTPLVIDGVLYATGSWSRVYALDAASGRELWRFDPEVPGWKGRNVCCDVVNRGVAAWKGRIYLGTIDGRLIALDAATGKPDWEVQTTDPGQPYSITGAPRVVKGRVIIGNGGADLGVRGFFSAYDAETGKLDWRFYTVPASKEGPHEHPELEAAARTWSKDSAWESGLGGTVWDAFAFDPELDLLYVGVGNASVYDRERRSPGGGDNLYLASILAVRPETGKLVWHYQTTPGESWDYTATQHMILADLTIGGKPRKLLLQAPKNGFFYVLDRATGELLSAEKYVDVSWASHVDLGTGRPVERPEAHWSKQPAMVTPGPAGGHNWHPMAFSPRTGLVYIPSTSNVYYYAPDPNFELIPGAWNTGEDMAEVSRQLEDFVDAILPCNPSHITAWDPVKGRQVWRVNHSDPVPGGLLATATDLVFQGNGSGMLSAYDAGSGERIWQTDARMGIMAPPILYEVDGEQYITVVAGLGGSHGGHFTRFDHDNAGRILTYKLGGKATLPPLTIRSKPRADPPPLTASVGEIERGRELYGRHCFYCHGLGVRSSGLYPDLRKSSRAVHDSWNEIVLGGSLQAGGMASFADHLTGKQAQQIHAYVLARSHHEPGLLERAARWIGRYACIPVAWAAD